MYGACCMEEAAEQPIHKTYNSVTHGKLLLPEH
jgi:hypothetical protein